MLKQAIAEAEDLFDHPLKQYMLFSEFEQQVESRRLDDIPEAFKDNQHAQAYFGVFKKTLPETFSIQEKTSHETWVKLAFEVDEAVDKAVAENSINPKIIEAEIRKSLLPRLFKECKSVGSGMDQAKAMVELIVQITRVGLE